MSPTPSPAQAPAPRIIKKYPNRRLYDTETSSYIKLTEVKQLVMEREPLVVRDAKTGEDITRSILLQIILEEEAGGEPIFTEEVLSSIIQFYGNAMQGFLGPYLQRNMDAFIELQSKLGERSKAMTPEMWASFMKMQSPLAQGMMGNHVEQSTQLFLQMQEQMKKQSEQMLGALGLKKTGGS
ncbi:MAG: polyhydroxyalkanoate synthesis repressor PhaR [Burkholderiales bacterium]